MYILVSIDFFFAPPCLLQFINRFPHQFQHKSFLLVYRTWFWNAISKPSILLFLYLFASRSSSSLSGISSPARSSPTASASTLVVIHIQQIELRTFQRYFCIFMRLCIIIEQVGFIRVDLCINIREQALHFRFQSLLFGSNFF